MPNVFELAYEQQRSQRQKDKVETIFVTLAVHLGLRLEIITIPTCCFCRDYCEALYVVPG